MCLIYLFIYLLLIYLFTVWVDGWMDGWMVGWESTRIVGYMVEGWMNQQIGE